MIELRHLRYFVVVAEELHFSKAAVRLNMSQPPLSQQIKSLERDFGAELFRRNNRSVTLTQAGRDLYEQIVPWLNSLNLIAERVRRTSEGEEGQLSVGVTFSTSHLHLPRIISAFRDRYPNVSVRMREMTGERQVDALGKGLIDIGIMRLPVDESNLLIERLYDESLMAALPPGHHLASKRSLALIDLKSETFLEASHKSSSSFESIEGVCEKAGFKPRTVNVSSNLNTALGLVAVGMGVALVPASTRQSGPRNISYRPLRDSPRSTVAAVWRRGDDSSVIKLFVNLARSIAGEPKPNRHAGQ
jgi:DNA-binding transcriptional LysR family regulator